MQFDCANLFQFDCATSNSVYFKSRSWNQPVLNNTCKVSCSSRQQEPSIGFKFTPEKTLARVLYADYNTVHYLCETQFYNHNSSTTVIVHYRTVLQQFQCIIEQFYNSSSVLQYSSTTVLVHYRTVLQQFQCIIEQFYNSSSTLQNSSTTVLCNTTPQIPM